MIFDRSSKFDLCYYGQVKIECRFEMAKRNPFWATFILLAMVHELYFTSLLQSERGRHFGRIRDYSKLSKSISH